MQFYPLQEKASSYYEASATEPARHPRFQGKTHYDVAIIGAGYTGLSAALTLAKLGKAVAIFEAFTIGWGASGRNGGQAHNGMRLDQDALERMLGESTARELWSFSQDAKEYLHTTMSTYGIECDYVPGIIHAAHKKSFVADHHRYAEKLSEKYNYTSTEKLDHRGVSEQLGSDCYYGGYIDRDAGHLHPLKLTYGLATAVLKEGALIFEKSKVNSYRRDSNRKVVINLEGGEVTADYLLICGNGYMTALNDEIDRSILPINNFIVATEPLTDAEHRKLLPNNFAVSDSRFVVLFWRKSRDGRLIFGGGENYSARWPKDIAAFVRHYMLKIYPWLKSKRIDFSWGGTLALTRSRMPYVKRLHPNVFVAAGYCGQGVVLAPFVGHVLGRAVNGSLDKLDLLEKIPTRHFPGGRHLRWPILVAGLTWHAILDQL